MTTLISWLRRLALALLVLGGPALALAADDPPGRVGRLSDLQGSVSWFDGERGDWSPAVRNRPLTAGDRLSTDGDARAEIRIGSTTLRLDGGTEVEFLRLDDDRIRVELHTGGLALRVRAREVADEVEVVTRETRLHPLRSGHYRIDRLDDSTYAASWRGELRVEDDDEPFTVDTGRRAEVWREGRALRRAWTRLPDDGFADYALREDRRDERSASYRYVSPEMTGAEELDRYGRWDQHPDYGAIWYPQSVPVGWAPYRYGHWSYIAPWGWTWVDDAPWGFAPFHYGRWVWWRERWCWTPGTYVARPVYAPALVAWVGGPNVSIGITVGGGPSVGWVPLAPRERFVPYYRSTPRHVDIVNRILPGGRPMPQPAPNEPIMYSNQGVPNAVTVVPRDVLVNRQPVARAVVDLRGEPQRRPLPVLRNGPDAVVPAPQPVARPAPPPPRAVEPPRPVVQPVRPQAPVVRDGDGDARRFRGFEQRQQQQQQQPQQAQPQPVQPRAEEPVRQQPPAVVDLRREQQENRRPPAAEAPPRAQPPQAVQPQPQPVQRPQPQPVQPAQQAPQQPAPVRAEPPRNRVPEPVRELREQRENRGNPERPAEREREKERGNPRQQLN